MVENVNTACTTTPIYDSKERTKRFANKMDSMSKKYLSLPERNHIIIMIIQPQRIMIIN